MCVCADLGDGHVAEVATEVLEVEIQHHDSSYSVSHASEQQQQSAATSTEGKHVQLVLVA